MLPTSLASPSVCSERVKLDMLAKVVRHFLGGHAGCCRRGSGGGGRFVELHSCAGLQMPLGRAVLTAQWLGIRQSQSCSIVEPRLW